MTTPLRRRSRRARRALALAALLAAAPSSAQAATVSLGEDGVLTWTAKAGANHVVIERFSESVRIEDVDDHPGAVPAICATEPGDWTYCQLSELRGVRVVLGDGNDRAIVDGDLGIAIAVEGGAGNDALDGSAGADDLKGGEGDDIVQGGAGNDALEGDGGERSGRDTVDGGLGVDRVTLDWSEAAHPGAGRADVSLNDGADDGFAGEGDDVLNVEVVEIDNAGRTVGTDAPEDLRRMGGPSGGAGVVEALGGDDVLVGGTWADTLDGGAGSDRITGGFGDDRLIGGPGRDTIVGDTDAPYCNRYSCSLPFGNDTVEARDGEADSITCGPGTDTVVADAVDVVAPDCERVELPASGGGGGGDGRGGGGGGGNRTPAPAKLHLSVARSRLGTALKRGLTVRLTGAAPGRVQVRAVAGRRVVASGTAKVDARGGAKLTLRFTAAARRSLARRRTVALRVAVGSAAARITLRR